MAAWGQKMKKVVQHENMFEAESNARNHMASDLVAMRCISDDVSATECNQVCKSEKWRKQGCKVKSFTSFALLPFVRQPPLSTVMAAKIKMASLLIYLNTEGGVIHMLLREHGRGGT